ncbi:MAG TPA: hypothetical protein VD973_16315 [Symbiobacteriaceae bacterium]|nr:hypothetical protein [Symbiobacteriaceae bacterium]
MPFSPREIVSAESIDLPVANTPNVNQMMILTGTVSFDFKGSSADTLRRETIAFPIAKLSGDMVKGMGFASLASICNIGISGSAGWAVDQVRVKHDAQSERVMLEADVAVRDADGYIERLTYMAFVMAKV